TGDLVRAGVAGLHRDLARRGADLHLGDGTEMRARAVGLILTLAITGGPSIDGQGAAADRSAPPDEERFLNIALPEIQITTATADRIALNSLAAGQPLLLALVFTRCAGVCSPFLMSWRAANRELSNRRRVQHLVLSFDPRDSPADMAALARHLDLDDD